MAYDPNYTIVVGGHAQAYTSDGSVKTSAGSPAAPVADLTALQAIASTTRTDGMIVVKLDDSTAWIFDAEGAAVAATWCAVPTSGTGRWYRCDTALRTTATIATLKAVPLLARVDGAEWMIVADGSMWRFATTSVLTTDGDNLLIVPTVAGGAYIRMDREVDIQLAVSSATADATVLYTVPTGFRLQVTVPFWSVSLTFTTGTAGAAGLSSSNAGLSTKGDLLGGASGDLVATLVSTGAYAKGTVGAKIGKPAAVLSAGDTIRFDLVAGTYTAGTGIAHVPVRVILAPAA